MIHQPAEAATRTDAPDAGRPYAGRRAVLATMHGKASVVAPRLRDALGLTVETATGIDTDALGTFTGEVPRLGSMRDTAIAKARLGMAATGLRIGIASEGSYGPHPLLPLVPGGIELMVLVDDTRGIVITEHLLVDAPAYAHAEVAHARQLEEFLSRIGFPDHAVIVKPNLPATPPAPLRKGLRSARAVAEAVARCTASSRDRLAFVQTDMRAHMNPTRMAAIGDLARRLGARAALSCPACAMPGYGRVDVQTGLPCCCCGHPSELVRYEIFGCAACAHRQRLPRADGLACADPGQCPRCNP